MSLEFKMSEAASTEGYAETVRAEAALIDRTRAGDRQGFNEIIRLHTQRVYNFIYQMTRHRQDAEDLAQQTFIKAFQNLHRFDASRPIIAWLLTIARRSTLNHFRSAKKWDQMPETLPASDPSPAKTAEQNETKNNLWTEARRLLSQREFEVLWLRFGEDLSTEETARVVGLTQTHVKVIVFRAKKHLLNLQTP